MVIGTFAIAFNLFSIAGTLKNNGRAEVGKNLCSKRFALIYSVETTQKNIDTFNRLMAKKIGIPIGAINNYCDKLEKFKRIKSH